VRSSINWWNRSGLCLGFNPRARPGSCRSEASRRIETRRRCLERTRDPFRRIRRSILSRRAISRRSVRRFWPAVISARPIAREWRSSTRKWREHSRTATRSGKQIVRRDKTLTIVGVVDESGRRLYRRRCIPQPLSAGNRGEPAGNISLVVRTAGAPLAVLPAVRSIAGSLSKNAVIGRSADAGDVRKRRAGAKKKSPPCVLACWPLSP
jgi:hypothetical protein